MKIKHSYHPDVIYLALYDKSIKNELLKVIPSSTYYNWIKKGDEHFFTPNFIKQNHSEGIDMAKKLAEHHKFIKLVKGYFFMYNALEQILKSIPNHQQIIKNNKNIVQQAFYNASKYISKKRIYKFFNVSYDFINYKTPLKCSNNILNTCLKKSNNQLTNPEIKTIQNYFSQHKNWQKASVYWKMISDKTICFSYTNCILKLA